MTFPIVHSRRQVAIALGTLAVMVVGAILIGYYWHSQDDPLEISCPAFDPSDPRVAYSGPFRNVRPDVDYVGTERCAVCHAEIAQKFAKHPMGHSTMPVGELPIGELAENTTTEFPALGSQFTVGRNGNRLWYRERRLGTNGQLLFEMNADINYVIGSGNKGQSFLRDQGGFVTQAPVSWFTQKQIWDESPGFPAELHVGREIKVGCIYCHANSVVPVPGALNRFEEPLFRGGHAIGCERCHGPGGEHVRLREGGLSQKGIDYSIVNPKHLEPNLREAVCQQCHLAGETRIVRAERNLTDFRPGLPLDSVIRVLVKDHRGDDRKAVNHVEQMYASKCFTASGGGFGCSTCHDPHEKPSLERRTERYQAACLKCHDCTVPIATRKETNPLNDCTACHMPKFAAGDIVHAASTDHRIIRRRDEAKPAKSKESVPMVFFPFRAPNLQSLDESRDYAVGLTDLAMQHKLAPPTAAREALPLLEQAIAASPSDYRAWEAKAFALEFLGRKSEAFAASQRVVALATNFESGLSYAAILASEVKQIELAREYWRRAIAINPLNASYREEFAITSAKTGRWSEAKTQAEEAIRLDPARAFARIVLAVSLFREGDNDRAKTEFALAKALQPPNWVELQSWYANYAK